MGISTKMWVRIVHGKKTVLSPVTESKIYLTPVTSGTPWQGGRPGGGAHSPCNQAEVQPEAGAEAVVN